MIIQSARWFEDTLKIAKLSHEMLDKDTLKTVKLSHEMVGGHSPLETTVISRDT